MQGAYLHVSLTQPSRLFPNRMLRPVTERKLEVMLMRGVESRSLNLFSHPICEIRGVSCVLTRRFNCRLELMEHRIGRQWPRSHGCLLHIYFQLLYLSAWHKVLVGLPVCFLPVFTWKGAEKDPDMDKVKLVSESPWL